MSAEATGIAWRSSPWKGQHAKMLVHLAVADVVNDVHVNEFWMSHSALAEKVGCRRATVSEWFAEAVELGFVVVLEDNSKAGRPNRYRLLDGPGVYADRTGVSADRTGGVRSPYTELKITKENSSTTREVAEVAERVLAAWVEATNRDAARTRLNAKRVKVVERRLKEGYTEDDLVAAVRGIALSPWHRGENPDRKRYDDMELALRDGGRVEQFRDLFCERQEPVASLGVDDLFGDAR
jgi:hypothetical protein